jgi:predicted DNA-binding transcriptional regulator YafY
MAVEYDLYDLIAGAIRARKQILCTYHGAPRELCPIMLGHKNGVARVLTWQFAGTDEKGDPVAGSWKCLALDEISDVHLHDGPWHAGDSHRRPQTCLDEVDFDVNPAGPYQPRHKV